MHTKKLGTLLAVPLALGLVGAARATVVGGANQKSSCYATFEGITASGTLGKTPLVTCPDGAACDADGAENNSCTFTFQACAFQSGVDGCTPSAVTKYGKAKVKPPKGGTLSLNLPATGATEATCAANSTLVVPMKIKKGTPVPTTVQLTLPAKGSAKPKNDKNVVAFRCVRACPANTAGGPKQLTFRVKDSGSNLSTGWKGPSHGFPVTPNSEISMCLSGCSASGGACTGTGETGAGTANGRFFGAPLPLLTSGVPVCVLNRFNGTIDGASADPTTGQLSATVKLKSDIFLTSTSKVCPRCLNGTCDSGANLGKACTVDGTLTVAQAIATPGIGKSFPLSRDCPPGGSPAGTLDITLPLTTETSEMASDTCGALPVGECKVAYQPLPEGCGTCDAACTGLACVDHITDPVDPAKQVCKDSKGGINRSCCSNDSTRSCFPVSNGTNLTLSGLRAAPTGTDKLTGDETVVAAFCVPATGACNVDVLTGLPGMGSITLPISTEWLK